jgi:hypothetical protein
MQAGCQGADNVEKDGQIGQYTNKINRLCDCWRKVRGEKQNPLKLNGWRADDGRSVFAGCRGKNVPEETMAVME